MPRKAAKTTTTQPPQHQEPPKQADTDSKPTEGGPHYRTWATASPPPADGTELKKEKFHFGSGVPLIEKANLCRYLATMLGAGLSLPEAVQVYAKDSNNAHIKRILLDVEQQLQQGKNLSAAISRYPKVFDHIMVSLIRAGETSGTLHQALNYLFEYLYSEYKLKQKVKSALMYPIIILLAMVGVGCILVFFVMPKIAPIFLQMRVDLPFYTEAMLRGGLFLSDNAIVIIPAMLGALAMVAFMGTRTQGKKILIKFVSLIPAIKNLFNYLDIARFCRTLSTLMSSGVPINEATQIVANSLSQPKYHQAIDQLSKDIPKGISMAESLRAYPKLFPQMTVRMIAAGEKTGTVEVMLSESADYYEEEIEDLLNNFANVIEPILLLLVGIGVGVMVVAIIGPIYSLVGGIQNST